MTNYQRFQQEKHGNYIKPNSTVINQQENEDTLTDDEKAAIWFQYEAEKMEQNNIFQNYK